MIRTHTAAVSGLVASAAAIAVTALNAGQVRDDLADAFTYPTPQGLSVEEASSMTMTYLFVISGAGLVVSLIYLASRQLAASRSAWWVGSAAAAIGLLVATYNATQVFPTTIKIVYFFPVIAGVLWLVTSQRGRVALSS